MSSALSSTVSSRGSSNETARPGRSTAMDLSQASQTGRLNLSLQNLTAADLPNKITAVRGLAPHLQELDLRTNSLTDLPSDIGELRNLKTIRLNYNQLDKIPRALASLAKLSTLDLGGNRILQTDQTLGRLTSLRDLDLSGNGLQRLDPSIGKLKELQRLVLENNQLTSLPEAIGDLMHLQKLDVGSNYLEKLPDSLGPSGARKEAEKQKPVPPLKELSAKHNYLKTVPPSLGRTHTLRKIDLEGNPLQESYANHYEVGIMQLLKFLQEEEERLEQIEIERLKPVGYHAGSWLEYKIKYTLVEGEDPRPHAREGSTLTFGNNRAMLFGGKHDDALSADTFYMNLDRLQWQKLSPQQSRTPFAREGHVAAYDEYNRRFLVFGGRLSDRLTNDMFALDIVSLSWQKVEQDGTPPEPREYATSIVWGRTLIVFGGRGEKCRHNDVHFFDLDANTWKQPFLEGDCPAPRQSAALALRGDTLYLYGGRNAAFTFDDVFGLNLEKKSWYHIETDGFPPGPRHSHALCWTDNALWVFGGYVDIHKTPSASLHRLDLSELGVECITEEGMPDFKKAHWMEMEAEVSLNPLRISLFYGNMLTLVQRGSQSEATGETSETNGERIDFYDCFKSVEIQHLKEKQLPDDVLRPPNPKKQRSQRIMTQFWNSMPRELKEQSAKEKKMIEHMQNFRKLFVELYPNRKPLLLYAPNECGVTKPICSALKPTKLPYTYLHQEGEIAEFVRGFFIYEHLDDPLSFPVCIPSPWMVVQWQRGDCFDMAIVLCSLLLGVGYDAFVVIGYAPKRVTMNERAEDSCPFFENEKLEGNQGQEKEESERERILRTTKYTTRRKSLKEESPESSSANFLGDEQGEEGGKEGEALENQEKPQKDTTDAEPAQQDAQQKQAQEQESTSPQAETSEEKDVEELLAIPPLTKGLGNLAAQKSPEHDLFGGHRRHAWVCVKRGRRHVPETHYLEPTTGERFSLKENPYEGIEMIFNNSNLWVNMRNDAVRCGKGNMLPELDFDVSNLDNFEPLLGSSDPFSGSGTSLDADHQRPETTGSQDRPVTSKSYTGSVSVTSNSQDAPSDEYQADADKEQGGPVNLMVDMPLSWSPPIQVTQEQYDTRCPNGVKAIKYKRAKHEIFALYGEKARWDGLVERVQAFADDHRKHLERLVELFKRRKDKLSRRETYPREGKVIERFQFGSAFAVRESVLYKGREKTVWFRDSSRVDGLAMRKEIYSQREEDYWEKIIEHFTGREDFLEKREVTYDKSTAGMDEQPQSRLRSKRRDESKFPIYEIVETYSHDSSANAPPSEFQVAVRKYIVARDTIKVKNHYARGRVTAAERVFTKNGGREVVALGPLEQKPSRFDMEEQYKNLLTKEQEAVDTVRKVEAEAVQLDTNRQEDELSISLVTPYYDVTRTKGERVEKFAAQVEERTTATTDDFLAPYLPDNAKDRILTAAEAKEVWEKCKASLKARLTERANIIQRRKDEEDAYLQKLQANFQRDRDQQSDEAEEEYERLSEESMFRRNIAQQRIQQHEKLAVQKYHELENKLRNDPRLAALHMST